MDETSSQKRSLKFDQMTHRRIFLVKISRRKKIIFMYFKVQTSKEKENPESGFQTIDFWSDFE